MGILEKEILVWVGGNNVRYYESLGYNIPKYTDNQGRLKIKKGTKILVKVEDLTKWSTVKVTKVCDICEKKIPNQEYGLILSQRKEDEKDKCYNCGKRDGGVTRKNNIPYENSLEFFAIQNNMEYLLKEFSNKNILTSRDYSHGTEQFVWWNCPDCKSEYDMKISMRTNLKCHCPYCAGQRVNHTNCLWTTHPEVAKLLVNLEDGYKVTKGKTQKVEFSCPDCGYKEPKIIQHIIRQGYSCSKCSDGLYYPEKFMINFLEQLELDFKTQKVFDWSKRIYHLNPKYKQLSGNKIYDFYISSLNLIIETHGQQHYEVSFETVGGRTQEDEAENDDLKYFLAKNNGVIKYVSINCTKSELEWIKNNILKSELNELFDLSKINWLKCHEFACKSVVKTACDLWNKYKNIKDITKELHVEHSTVRRYLIQGSKLGLCDYDPQKEKRKTMENNLKNFPEIRRIKIVQLTEEGNFIREWASATDAKKELSINNIPTVLNGRQDTAGGFKWMYKEKYDELIRLNGEVKFKLKPRIIKLSLDEEFIAEYKNIGEALKSVGRNSKYHSSIKTCCENNKRTAFGFKWMYKEDYNLKINEILNIK